MSRSLIVDTRIYGIVMVRSMRETDVGSGDEVATEALCICERSSTDELIKKDPEWYDGQHHSEDREGCNDIFQDTRTDDDSNRHL